jgi:hypothetical protein
MPGAISRRSFLAGLGGLAVAGGTGAVLLGERRIGSALGARLLERGVALGPGGVGDTQRYASNRRFFAETHTRWVRLWADWPVVQPERGRPPDLAALDEQIDAARADGLEVMLTAWRFPRWANGTGGLSSAADARFETADRVAPGGDPARRKDLTFKLPDDLGPESDWARWIDLLLDRCGDRIDALELLNEPNLQLWPQRGLAGAVATMMQTAQAVAGRHPGAPLLVAPATSDAPGDTRLRTRHDDFTRDLLAELERRRFEPGPRFAWSHHSYTDVELDRASGTAATRALLAGRWAGWPDGDAARPWLMVTETGARLDKLAEEYGLADPAAARAKQAELIERYWGRIRAERVGLMCVYLFVTDASYDSGLCDLDGTPRPAYRAWARLSP